MDFKKAIFWIMVWACSFFGAYGFCELIRAVARQEIHKVLDSK
jgi:hypothetical protein